MKIGHENKMLKLNTPLAGRPAGSQVKVVVDEHGTPVDRYWRRRLKDSEVDGCVEIVETKKKAAKETN